MLPKSGTKFPTVDEKNATYAMSISRALVSEIGTDRLATKTIIRWTGASDRSARHWLNGTYGPGGWHLILLARRSPSVMKTILQLANYRSLEPAIDLTSARAALIRATTIIDALLQEA
jgi:hypothetical protein